MRNRFSMFVVSPTGHMTEFNLTEYHNYVRGSTDEKLAANQVFVNEDHAADAVALILAKKNIIDKIDHLDALALSHLSNVIDKWLNNG